MEKQLNREKIFVCRCEEVTEDEVRGAIRAGAGTADGVKRATRAEMGLCRSKTCYLNIVRLLHEERGLPMENITPMLIKIPVRPDRFAGMKFEISKRCSYRLLEKFIGDWNL